MDNQETTRTLSPIEIALTSPALKYLSEHYPANRRGRVPLKVRMAKTAYPDLPFKPSENIVAHFDQEYYVWCNSHGAMVAILENGKRLGIKPSECEIIEWHDGNALEGETPDQQNQKINHVLRQIDELLDDLKYAMDSIRQHDGIGTYGMGHVKGKHEALSHVKFLLSAQIQFHEQTNKDS